MGLRHWAEGLIAIPVAPQVVYDQLGAIGTCPPPRLSARCQPFLPCPYPPPIIRPLPDSAAVTATDPPATRGPIISGPRVRLGTAVVLFAAAGHMSDGGAPGRAPSKHQVRSRPTWCGYFGGFSSPCSGRLLFETPPPRPPSWLQLLRRRHRSRWRPSPPAGWNSGCRPCPAKTFSRISSRWPSSPSLPSSYGSAPARSVGLRAALHRRQTSGAAWHGEAGGCSGSDCSYTRCVMIRLYPLCIRRVLAWALAHRWIVHVLHLRFDGYLLLSLLSFLLWFLVFLLVVALVFALPCRVGRRSQPGPLI